MLNYRILITLNICLAFIVCLLVMKVYGVWSQGLNLPPVSVDKKVTRSDTSRYRGNIEAKRPKKSYDIMVTKNLFSPSRTETEKEHSLMSESEIILCGTLIWGEYKTALLEMPKEAGQDALKEIKIGDTVAGYRVADILDDRVILESEQGGKSYVLDLQRQKEKRKHVRTSVPKASRRVSRGRGVEKRSVPAKRTPTSSRKPPTSRR